MSIQMVAVASALVFFASSTLAAERVGKTVEAQETVSGEGAVGKRVIARADPIYRNERLRSNLTGLGQFELGDGSKLVLGRNASLDTRSICHRWRRHRQERNTSIALRISPLHERCQRQKGISDQHAAGHDRCPWNGIRSDRAKRQDLSAFVAEKRALDACPPLMRFFRKQQEVGFSIPYCQIKCCSPHANRSLRGKDPIGAFIACAGDELCGP